MDLGRTGGLCRGGGVVCRISDGGRRGAGRVARGHHQLLDDVHGKAPTGGSRGWKGGPRTGGAALAAAAAAVRRGAAAGVAFGPGVFDRCFGRYRHGSILVLQRRDPNVLSVVRSDGDWIALSSSLGRPWTSWSGST